MRCQEVNVYFIGILRVSVHHIQSTSVASLTDLSLKETNFSLIKKKKKPWSALGVLGNCVLKKWSYIREDTPVTLACQEDRRCRKSTHRGRSPVGAKEEKLYPLRCIYSQREVVFGMSVWHQRSPSFYPVELLFLVGVVGRSFLFRRGRGEERWVFSIVHHKASPPPVERVQVSSFWRQDGSQKQSPGQQLWWLPSQRCLMRERKDVEGCRGSTQQSTVCRTSVWASQFSKKDPHKSWTVDNDVQIYLSRLPVCVQGSFKRRTLSRQN